MTQSKTTQSLIYKIAYWLESRSIIPPKTITSWENISALNSRNGRFAITAFYRKNPRAFGIHLVYDFWRIGFDPEDDSKYMDYYKKNLKDIIDKDAKIKAAEEAEERAKVNKAAEKAAAKAAKTAKGSKGAEGAKATAKNGTAKARGKGVWIPA